MPLHSAYRQSFRDHRRSRPVVRVVRVVAGVVASVMMLATIPSIAAADSPRTSGAAQRAAVLTVPGSYVPVPLAAAVNTRSGLGSPKTPIPGSSVRTVQITGKVGVPASGVSAVVLSITAINPPGGGWLTAFATGTTKPGVASLNWVTNRSATATVTVAVSSAGQVDLSNGSSQPVDLTVDVAGYYVGGAVTAAGGFVPVTPTRSLDTRSGVGASRTSWVDDESSIARTLTWQVAGRSGVPATGVSAVVMSVTAANPARNGWLSVGEDQGGNPAIDFNGTWTTPIRGMAFDAAVPTTNLFVVSLSAAGKAKLGTIGIDDFAGVDAIADVVGYLKGGGTSGVGLFQSSPPMRLTQQSLPGNGTLRVPVDAPPSSTVTLTVHAENQTAWGSIYVFATGTPRPAAAAVKYGPGRRVTATVTVAVSASSTVDLLNGSASALDVTVDQYGYYRGSTPAAATVWSFGANDVGQLAHGTTSLGSAAPAPVLALPGTSAVIGAASSGYAIRTDGSLWAWGKNSNDDDIFSGGQLGDGTSTDRFTPVRVHNVSNVVQVAADYEVAYCLQADGSVWSWGAGTTGPSGDPFDVVTANEPVRVPGLTSVVSLTVSGFWDVVAVRADGTVWTWRRTPGSLPTQVAGVSGIVAANGTSLLRTDGRVQVGTSVLPGLTNITAVNGNYAIKSDGTLWTLGGQQVASLSGVTAVGGGFPQYALTSDGTLWTLNAAATPIKVPNLPKLRAIAGSAGSAMFVVAV